MPFKQVSRPIILGIVGDCAAGKTTLAAGIANILGLDKTVIVCTDDYRKYDRKTRDELGVTALDPESNHLDILEQHLHLLREGKPVLKPVYAHDRGTKEPAEYLEPREYIIVEGMLGYASRDMRDAYDVKVYLEPAEDLRIKWKIQRDTARRGYTPEDVMRVLSRRRMDSLNCVQPQRTFADMVVSFYPPESNTDETGAHLNVRHTLRPTLPHPDLSPILEAGAKKGFRLDLARDVDGKPVDVLEIAGDIDGKRAQAMEDLLWNLIPEARHLRDNVGRFIDGHDRQAMSHPLALSQLLITFHMVKAALGHHAV